jgi:hypothetical protein
MHLAKVSLKEFLNIKSFKLQCMLDFDHKFLGEEQEHQHVCSAVPVCVCFWPPVPKWGTVMHEIPISSPPS